jgi:hypothetical protein
MRTAPDQMALRTFGVVQDLRADFELRTDFLPMDGHFRGSLYADFDPVALHGQYRDRNSVTDSNHFPTLAT